MPRKSDSVKGKLERGITEDRFSVILNVKLVQKMKHIALNDDVTEKDLYYEVMKEYIATRTDVVFPEYLNEKQTMTVKKGK